MPRCDHLLYRATRDGWTPAIFHLKCDGKGPTLTLIQTNTNHILGGFTSVSWTSPIYPRPCADRTAFMFSLRRGSDHGGDGGPPVRLDQWQNPDFAVRHDAQYGPSFGFDDLCTLGSTLINLRSEYILIFCTFQHVRSYSVLGLMARSQAYPSGMESTDFSLEFQGIRRDLLSSRCLAAHQMRHREKVRVRKMNIVVCVLRERDGQFCRCERLFRADGLLRCKSSLLYKSFVSKAINLNAISTWIRWSAAKSYCERTVSSKSSLCKLFPEVMTFLFRIPQHNHRRFPLWVMHSVIRLSHGTHPRVSTP